MSTNKGQAPETHEQLTHRVLIALTELVELESKAPTVVVAHGGMIRSLLEYASAGTRPLSGEQIKNGSVTLFSMTSAGLTLAADAAT